MMTRVSVLAALAQELGPLAEELAPLGQALAGGDEEAAARYLALLERLSNVIEMLELPALGELYVHVLGNIPAQIGVSESDDLLAGWPLFLEQFLRMPDDFAARSTLVACLSDDRWADPMEIEEAESLLEQLLASDIDIADQPRQPRQFVAADTELQWLPDLTTEMRGAFQHEAPRYAATLNRHLAQLSTDGKANEDLRQARRMAHTLKGSAALVGARAVVNLTDLLEDLLERLQESPDRFSQKLIDDLQNAGDGLEEMIEAFLDQGSAPTDILGLLQQMDRWVVDLDQVGESTRYEPIDAAEPAMVMDEVANKVESIDSGAPQSGQTMTEASNPEPSINLPLRAIDEMLRAVADLLVQFGHLQTRLRDGVERSSHLENHLFTMQQTVLELETLIDLRATPAVQSSGGRAPATGFDLLELDQYNLLHSLGRVFSESALDAREMARELHERLMAMQNLMRQQQRIGREVNNAVMATRLVRVSTQENRWQRTVRQTCRATGKKAALTLEGGELSIDTDILNALVEPLLHLLRNAVDHGIEPPEERAAAGKPESGHLRLVFRQDGNRIMVELSDDGRGLDEQAIVARAQALQLFPSDHQPGPTDIQHAILALGFSTRDTVTETSGRGIGLDVVRGVTQKIGGTLTLHNRLGQGLSVKLTLPQSLTSTHLLFVSVGQAPFALPSLRINQILFSDSGVIEKVAGRRLFRIAEQECPIHSLADLLGVTGEANLDDMQASQAQSEQSPSQPPSKLSSRSSSPRPVVLMNTDQGQIALLVDRVVESREAVVKSLHPHFPGLRGVSGTCILADGDVAMVLDPAELELSASPESRQVARRVSEIVAPQSQRPRVLIADDSLSARRSLSRLIEDLGYTPLTAIDGVEALEIIEDQAPDVLLLDLEMPRMNGLELTAHLRSREDTRDLPVLMVTSRSTAKHRREAERVGVSHYMTKPYQEHDLADLLSDAVAGRMSGITA